MRDYNWCNLRYRSRKPRSRSFFKLGYDRIEYHLDEDVFKLKYNDITMHRDGRITVENVDNHLMHGFQQGWMQRVFDYTGVWLKYPKDRKLHAYATAGNKYITGDFTVLPDRSIVCKAPLRRWQVDKTMKAKREKQTRLLNIAAKFTEKDKSYDYWTDRSVAQKNIFNPDTPLATRVKWWVNMPEWTFRTPTRSSKFGNIRKGYWVLRPVPRAK